MNIFNFYNQAIKTFSLVVSTTTRNFYVLKIYTYLLVCSYINFPDKLFLYKFKACIAKDEKK